MSASTGHLRPGSAGEARRRAFALALPILGLLALIATLPVGGAAIAAGAARLRRHLRGRAAARPRPARLAVATAAHSRRRSTRAIDAVEAPARALSLVAFVAIVWFIPIRVYTLPAPGPVKLEPYRLMVLLLAAALLLGAISGARRIRTCGVGGALLTLSASAVISLAVQLLLVHRARARHRGHEGGHLPADVPDRVRARRLRRALAQRTSSAASRRSSSAAPSWRSARSSRRAPSTTSSTTCAPLFPFLQDTGERAAEVRSGALRAEASAQHPIALGVALALAVPLSLAMAIHVQGRAAAHRLRRLRAAARDRHGRDDLAHGVPGARGHDPRRARRSSAGLLLRLWPLAIVLLIARAHRAARRHGPALQLVLPEGRHHERAVRARRRRRLRTPGRPRSGVQARAGQRLLRHRRSAAAAARPRRATRTTRSTRHRRIRSSSTTSTSPRWSATA